jgi:colanic acid biosynthesis glycosyl transferase WcaI
MRILVLSQYFWPETFRINDLVVSLRDRGYEVHVLTGKPNYPLGDIFPGYGFFKKWRDRFHDVDVTRVPLYPRGRGGFINLSLNYLSFVVSACLFGLPRLRGKFDCVFVFGASPITVCLPAILYKRFTGTPVTLWVQDLWPESVSAVGAVRQPWMLKFLERLVRYIYKNCDLVLIQSEAFLPKVSKFCKAHEKIAYLPNWAEDFYQPLARHTIADDLKEMPTGFRIVFAGNLGRAQSLPTIVEAAMEVREYKDIHWIILGDGSERENFKQLVRRAGLQDRFHFLGHRPVHEMPKYFAMADALLVTLKNDDIFSDTIPSKVQSYLACGRPILAAMSGEGRRVLDESGGALTCPSEDAKGLADNVARLYAMNEQERESLGAHCFEYNKKFFHRTKVISNLEEYFLRVTPEANRG